MCERDRELAVAQVVRRGRLGLLAVTATSDVTIAAATASIVLTAPAGDPNLAVYPTVRVEDQKRRGHRLRLLTKVLRRLLDDLLLLGLQLFVTLLEPVEPDSATVADLLRRRFQLLPASRDLSQL